MQVVMHYDVLLGGISTKYIPYESQSLMHFSSVMNHGI